MKVGSQMTEDGFWKLEAGSLSYTVSYSVDSAIFGDTEEVNIPNLKKLPIRLND